ncbi:MAG: DUF134 domain-containing protein [Thermoplasmata archaeon]
MMPRPKRCRRVCYEPGFKFFKPQGIPLDLLEKREIELDELEAIRLADMLGLSQVEAAGLMNISQPTFSRILASGRRKIAECIINGLALKMKAVDASDNTIRLEVGGLIPGGRARRRRRGCV